MLTPDQARRLADDLLDDEQASEDAPSPEFIDRYRLVSLIGHGGQSWVFEAEQEEPKRRVAIKLMRPYWDSERAAARIRDEARFLAALDHPAIAKIHDAGTWNDGRHDLPWIAMEFIDGSSPITAYAEEHRVCREERLALFATVCEAVHHAHQRMIIHRDLKPRNVLVDEQGRPRIIDFGIARATDADVRATSLRTDSNEIVGTLQYMSPEQCNGDPHAIDSRSDVYSLGAILYELLCRRCPYELSRSIPKATREVQELDPVAPHTIDSTLRPPLEAIMLKALRKDPDDRYSSAADMASDVRRYLAGQPTLAQPPTLWTRVMNWAEGHPLLLVSSASLLILLSSLTISFASIWYFNRRPHSVELLSNRRAAVLRSFAGNELDRWDVAAGDEIAFAEFVRQPESLGGQPLAIIGFSGSLTNAHPGCLCAFNANASQSDPEWSHRIDENLLIDSFKGEIAASGFGIASNGKSLIADVFPDRDGLEIIGVFSHDPSSGAAIRVFDTAGEELYRIWHDGAISDIHWMSGAGMLMVIAMNSEVTWAERGYLTPTAIYPRVIFVVEPELFHLGEQIVTTTPGVGDLATTPWYKCLPPDVVDRYTSIRFSRPYGGLDLSRAARVEFCWDEKRRVTATVVINELGDLVSYTAADEYKRLTEDTPDLRSLKLIDLPRILDRAE